MRVLVDTNIIVRSVQKNHPACPIARQALLTFYRAKHELYLAPQNFTEWRSIVVAYAVRGAKVHDARLAAAMKVYSLPQILTFNVQDFSRFPFVEAIHPEELLGGRAEGSSSR